MPYIKTTANVAIPREVREKIKTQLGRDAAIIGKTESWLMVEFRENAPLYFKGTNEPSAMVSVDLFGAAGAGAYDKMTAAITGMLAEELGVPADRVFVKYSEYRHWGYNGRNF
jgi:hypothetical protein